MIARDPVPVAVIAATATWLVARLLLLPSVQRVVLDRPNERSLHATPVPRSGGLAMSLGVAAALGLAATGGSTLWLAAGLAAVSLLDDLRDLPTRLRLAIHVAAALAFVALELTGVPIAVSVVLVLAVGWMTNLYNFMDGSDGLAGGMAVSGFVAYALAGHFAGSDVIVVVCAAIAGAAGGFLAFNLPPARMFMGDAGSIPLGFLAAALGLLGWRDGAWPLWFPLLVFSPFVVDASVTLARRALRGARLSEAHREHYYQRLVRMGWGHRRTALAEYGLMLACAVAALAARTAPVAIQAGTLVAFGAAYVVLMWRIDVCWRRYEAEGA